MTEFKRKNKYNFWYSPLTLVALLFLLIFFSYKVINIVKKNSQTAHNKDLISNQLKSLQNRENTLTKNISRIQTNEGIESLIREKYQVVKKGEKMVIIVNNNDKDFQQTKSIKKNHSFGLWNWIKGIFKK